MLSNRSMKVTYVVSKCRLRARTSVYWPGINDDISDLVGQCETCQISQLRNQRNHWYQWKFQVHLGQNLV